jgi:uncharacterized protein YcfJ
MLKPLIALAGASALLCACADDPHVTNSALGGSAIGAVAGAVIGNNVGHGDALAGAAIGAVAGGAIGAAKGCADIGGCNGAANSHRQYYDERAQRYYYYDSATGRYYWEDGSPR